jgi:CRISPR-associated protein Cmr1
MEDLEFTLRLVSPAFIGGGEDLVLGPEQRKRRIDPEGDGLRIPSLRGVLRFWWRAKERDDDAEKLFAKEAAVFGSANKGQGVRIRPLSQDEWVPIAIPVSTAKTYLGSGAINNEKLLREAIPEDKRFKFCASGTRGQIEEVRKALILLHLFGGIGARSRRGWGSVHVLAKFIPGLPAREDGLADWFGKLFRLVWPEPESLSDSDRPLYSAFCRTSAVRRTKVRNGDYTRIFDEFYDHFREVRLSTSSSPLVKDDLTWEKEDAEWDKGDPAPPALRHAPNRLAYGLPYSPRAKNGSWKIEYHGRAPGRSKSKSEWTTRRASPLILKVHRFAPKRHFGVALHLDASFFGDMSLRIGAAAKRKPLTPSDPIDKPETRPPPGPAAIHDFLKGWTTIALP